MIKNKTNGKIIVKESEFCKNKAIGLMFSKRSDKGLIFEFNREKRISLHMLFVFYPIDLLFLDRNKKVTEIKKNFMPFAFYTSKNKVKYVIELPAGKTKGIRIGNSISLK